jgi:4-diphosphocytidyl-2-C-methyl-D-erythritol kinase
VRTETAYAKINLALHVRARRADGYHAIETLFAFCADGDRLEAAVRDDEGLTLTIDGPFAAEIAADESNLVLRAARALQAAAGEGRGADLRLTKALPIAAGLGGGSADAAAALRLLITLWTVRPIDIDLPAIALALGADVPACLASRTLLGRGVGERLAPVETGLGGTPVLLVNPRLPCPTGPVFAAWDRQDRGPLDPERWQEGRNDLEAAATGLVPEIAHVLSRLRVQPGVTLARMSGSGATCFALFGHRVAAEEARERIAATHPDWWLLASELRP